MAELNNINDVDGKHFHFIGIGGCSMSGLALIMNNNGYEVSGSDAKEKQYNSEIQWIQISNF